MMGFMIKHKKENIEIDLKTPEGQISISVAESNGKNWYNYAEKPDRYDSCCLPSNISKPKCQEHYIICTDEMFSTYTQ